VDADGDAAGHRDPVAIEVGKQAAQAVPKHV